MAHYNLGPLRIDRVAEIDHIMVEARWLFPALEDDALARNAHRLDARHYDPKERRLGMSFHSWLVRGPGLTMLVDTCNGNHKERPHSVWQHRLDTPWLYRLAELGVAPEDVTHVLCTHLHTDHVGWNTRLENGRWVPTFPNARYVVSQREFDYFLTAHRAGPSQPVNKGSFADSVLPVVDAGLFDFVADDHILLASDECEIRLAPAAGHSPGHVVVHVRAGAHHAAIAGDVIHHPIQLSETDLPSLADFDETAAATVRRSLCRVCAESGALLLTGHFPAPSAGHVRPDGAGFAFEYASVAVTPVTARPHQNTTTKT